MQFNNKHTANKEKLKKTNKHCKPFFANLNIISSKKLLVNIFKKFTKLYNILIFYTTKIHHLINLK